MKVDEEKWQHFRDVRRSKPEKGDVMARYQVMCEFGDGAAKRQLINLLRDTGKAEAAVQVMRKLHFAHPRDSIVIPLMIVRDLLSGMSPDAVALKPYVYLAEMFFYAKPEHVPREDKHWTLIPIESPRVSCYVTARQLSEEQQESDGSGKETCGTEDCGGSNPNQTTPKSE